MFSIFLKKYYFTIQRFRNLLFPRLEWNYYYDHKESNKKARILLFYRGFARIAGYYKWCQQKHVATWKCFIPFEDRSSQTMASGMPLSFIAQYVCTRARTRARALAHVHAYAYIYLYTHIYIRVFLYLYINIHTL